MALDISKILASALLEMAKTRKLDSIRVKDLLEETGLSRQAFYNRFRDKNDLIQWTYEHHILSGFFSNGPDASFYENMMCFYQTLDKYRYFMKQAVLDRSQNNLRDFMYDFAVQYDLQWHQFYFGDEPLSADMLFATRYHAVAAIDCAIQWVSSSNPDPPEVMARRLTLIRKISMSGVLLGPEHTIYDVPEPKT